MKPKFSLPRRKWLQLASLSTITGIASKYLTGSKPEMDEKSCALTPKQELGPFEPMQARAQIDKNYDLTRIDGKAAKAAGTSISISGKVMDQQCNPIKGAVVEVWQSNHFGKYNHEYDTEGQDDPYFQGWGQMLTDLNGEYQFKSILPGLYGSRTRHIHYKVQCRGYHDLVTQLYFEGEERNDTDGIYNSLTHDEQKGVTIALDNAGQGKFDIVMEKVDTAKLPKKVLAAYLGTYQVSLPEGGMSSFMQNTFGVDKNFKMEVSLENHQLYLKSNFINATEIFWKAKDTFDAVYLYDSTIHFKRNGKGDIAGFEVKMDHDDTGFIAVRIAGS